MCMRVPSSFEDHFASLSDPRSFHAPNLRHDLIDILVIAVCAVICGAEGWEDIEDYGNAQAEWFSEVLDLPHGIPGHDTFRRVLSRLDPDEFTQCFMLWTGALSDLSEGELVAIDGKTSCWVRSKWMTSPMTSPPFPSSSRCWTWRVPR